MQSTRTTNDSTMTTGATGTPAVSVIVPAYNVSRFITETLDSVFAQTFTDYEIIVVNDGSPDTQELERVLEPYRERITYLKQENRGPSAARNNGIRTARAPLVALLDGDDIWEPEFLSAILDEFRRDSSVSALYSDAIYFGDTTEAGRSFMELRPSTGEITFARLLAQECNVTSSVVVRRELLLRVGLFDEDLRSSEDFDLWLRVVKGGGRMAYLRRPLMRYRRHGESLSADPVWMCKHILRVLEKSEQTLSLTGAEIEVLRRQRRRYEGELHFNEGKRAFFRGDTEAAIASLSKANALLPGRKLAVALWLLRLAPGVLLRAYNLRDRFYFRADTKF